MIAWEKRFFSCISEKGACHEQYTTGSRSDRNDLDEAGRRAGPRERVCTATLAVDGSDLQPDVRVWLDGLAPGELPAVTPGGSQLGSACEPASHRATLWGDVDGVAALCIDRGTQLRGDPRGPGPGALQPLQRGLSARWHHYQL